MCIVSSNLQLLFSSNKFLFSCPNITPVMHKLTIIFNISIRILLLLTSNEKKVWTNAIFDTALLVLSPSVFPFFYFGNNPWYSTAHQLLLCQQKRILAINAVIPFTTEIHHSLRTCQNGQLKQFLLLFSNSWWTDVLHCAYECVLLWSVKLQLYCCSRP